MGILLLSAIAFAFIAIVEYYCFVYVSDSFLHLFAFLTTGSIACWFGIWFCVAVMVMRNATKGRGE